MLIKDIGLRGWGLRYGSGKVAMRYEPKRKV